MSASYRAAAVIGFRLPMAGFVLSPAARCGHRKPPGARFCPECGKEQAAERVAESHRAFRYGDWLPPQLVRFYVPGREEPESVAGDVAFVGHGLEAESWAGRSASMLRLDGALWGLDLEEMKADVRRAPGAFLHPGGPLALDHTRYGLWCLMDNG